MAEKGIWMLVFLLFGQQMFSCAALETKTVHDGDTVTIECIPASPVTMVQWFRVLDKNTVEFIASFRGQEIVKESPNFKNIFRKTPENKLEMTFNKERDSGLYTCAGINNNMLVFGKVTPVKGQATPRPPQPATTCKGLTGSTTTKACSCDGKTRGGKVSMMCEYIVLGPLAGGCGILFLLLIITICYCNRIRTRRCPHHNKRRPQQQMTAPVKQQEMASRYV